MNPTVLLICPPPLNPSIDSGPIFGPMFKGGVEKSNQLPNLYEAVAKMGGAGFLNAGSVISTDGIDGLHLTAEWFPFLDRSELAKLELSVDRNTEA